MVTAMESTFNQALLNDDDLIAVVRSHIFVERLLNRFIDSLLSYPDRFLQKRIGWPQKVDLAMALGLKAKYGPPLKKIGSIRNRFAHEPEAKITKKDATDLYGSLHEEEQKLVQESFKLMLQKRKGKVERRYDDLGPRDQFTLIMIPLHSMLLIAISTITGEPIDNNATDKGVKHINEELLKRYLRWWEKYVYLRNLLIDNLKYKNEREKFLLVLFARINSISEEILYLVKGGYFVSSQTLMRSALEAYIDLKCLVDDGGFVEVIKQSELDSEIKYYKNYDPENVYHKGSTKETFDKKLRELESRSDKEKRLNIFEKFQKADEVDAYRTVYNKLSSYSHGNLTALASKNFSNQEVVLSSPISDIELNLILSATVKLAIASTIEIATYYDKEIENIEKLKTISEEIRSYSIKNV